MGEIIDKVKGKIKQAAGKASGDKRLEREGQVDEAKGAVKGAVEEAKHALHDPFIEEFVEQTGRFRIQNFDNIQAVSGIPLGDLEIAGRARWRCDLELAAADDLVVAAARLCAQLRADVPTGCPTG